MRLAILGDISPTRSNEALFALGDIEALFGRELLEVWFSCEARVLNLETPLGEPGAARIKAGPNLIAPASCAAAIRALKPTLVCLANNHIMDYGENGLLSTFAALEEIETIGAGKNAFEARSVKSAAGATVYAVCENEFCAAGEASSGANAYDALTSFADVRKAGGRPIVLYHGGLEKYRYPTPNLRRVCRAFIDSGAGLVVCQHSHAVGCMEEYGGGKIIYGQGNALFDRFSDEYWNSGLLIVHSEEQTEVYPIWKENARVRIERGRGITEGFYARSEEIKRPGFVEAEFDARAASASYENKLFGRLGRAVRKFKIARRLMTGESAAQIVNMLDCETHRELASREFKLKFLK